MNKPAVARFAALICLALFSAGPAFTQNSMQQPIADQVAAAAAAAPVAYVYVQTPKGVNLYNAAANGSLTLVKGSPFKTVGEMVGSNGKYFITLGTYWIHVYEVASNGAIGKQVSTANTQDFDGANCGPTTDAGLDHTGQNLNVFLGWGYNCNAFQSFNVAKNTGALTFNGASTYDLSINVLNIYDVLMPTITANEKFAYDTNQNATGELGYTPLVAFERASDGVTSLLDVTETDPTPWPSYQWILTSVKADPTNHLAVVLYGYDGQIPDDQTTAAQLASYTVDSKGNIASTNTYEHMPVPAVSPNILEMSPSGKFLAVAGDNGPWLNPPSAGLQVFHFNGAAPITSFSKVLTTDRFYGNSLKWDTHNHLFALGTPAKSSTLQLFVFTVTPTGITAAPGSPFAITNQWESPFGNDLIIVSK